MKYTLNFSLKLERHHSFIVYNSELFTEKPIPISVPDVVKLFEQFIKTFEEVGIIEQPTSKTIPSEEKTQGTTVAHEEKLSDSKSVTGSTALIGLSGKARICKSQDLDEAVIEQFCTELTKYVQICCSKISEKDKFLSEEINLYISGLREVIELRNYLTKYTRSKKKAYQNGYLYVSVI
jgi:hypothetical protein